MTNKVRYYTRGVDKVIVNFPEDDVCCSYCPFMLRRTNNKLTRYACSRTLEPLGDIHRTIGQYCPLEIAAQEKNDEHI